MKKSLNKFLAVLLSLIFLISMPLVSFAEVQSDVNAIVLYTNDVHCAIDKYPAFAAYRAQLIAQGYTVITVDGGDAIQGEIIGTMTKGSGIADIMNTVGYNYAVPGNHEFDYSVGTFLELAENEANFSYTSCNFFDLIADKTVFEPYYIEDINGEKIAFVGITTPETYTKSTPEYFKNESNEFIYGFSENNFYDTIQSTVNEAVADGAERVIAIGHLGIDGTTDGWKSTDVIANTYGIDAFIDAHSHEKIDSAVYLNSQSQEVLLTSTSSKFGYFGQLTLKNNSVEEAKLIDPDSIDIETLLPQAQSQYNAVKKKVDSYNQEMEYLFEKIGISQAQMIVYDKDGNWLVRREETNMGDFVADAYREITGAQIAFANGGGIRSEIGVGDVTRKSLMDVNPWNNSMCVISVTGQQIMDALEHGAKEYPENSGGFLQVSGLTYEINAWIESPVIVDEMGSFVGIEPSKQRRVANVKVGGVKIDPEQKYTLAGNAYMLTQGGDGFTMFSGAEVIQSENLPVDSQMLIEYFTENLSGEITAEQYSNVNGDGRIVINKTQPEECVCICHSNCFAAKIIFCVLCFICKLLNVFQTCACTAVHW